ncbi:MAG TPA: alpha/beta fold hydrolase [Longimicrobiales bacterium]|nr:alpha/beta fold hydrolase [Longimicrobiales bacterium]
MLHGRGGSLEAWRWLADSLAADYRVIAIDQRGHGQSTKPVAPALYGPAMAQDVVALLDHLHIPRAHVVGFSLGAVVAAHVAANFSDRVRTASLLAGPFYADSAATAQATADYITEMESGRGRRESLRRLGLSDSAITVVNARMLANSTPAALLAMTRAMGNLMIVPERGATIRVPALVAVGTADGLLDNSRWLASWWPGAHLVEVPGATHGSILQRPEVLSAIRELLRAERSRER